MKKTEKILVVFIGMGFSSKNQSIFIFHAITDEEFNLGNSLVADDSKKHCYLKPGGHKNYGRPGTVWEMEVDDAFSCYGTSYKGNWKNKNDVLKWQTEYDVFQQLKKELKQESEGKKNNLVQEQLMPIKEMFRKMNYNQRRILISQIIEFISR